MKFTMIITLFLGILSFVVINAEAKDTSKTPATALSTTFSDLEIDQNDLLSQETKEELKRYRKERQLQYDRLSLEAKEYLKIAHRKKIDLLVQQRASETAKSAVKEGPNQAAGPKK